VTWLELFFDLVFVVVISELVHILSLDAQGIGNYLFLFIPAWWIWIGASYYNDRFESEGLDHRLFTFFLMLPVAGLAVFAHHVSQDNSIGYVLSYTIARCLIVFLWLRASIHEKRFRPVGSILIGGYSFSIGCFILSLWIDPAYRSLLWVVALICDLITPLFTLNRQKLLPHFNFSKLPERLGLFMLIVIGETLVAVIRGIARHHHFNFRIVSEGIVAIAISFGIWWLYFDTIAERSPKRQHKMFFLWSYLHLILAMAVGAVGASLLSILTARHHIPADNARYVMTGALGVALSAMALIEIVLEPKEGINLKMSLGTKFGVTGLLLAIGAVGHAYHAFHLLLLIFLVMITPILMPLASKIGVKIRTHQNR
jgi:low temperature requirement protein LtrA